MYAAMIKKVTAKTNITTKFIIIAENSLPVINLNIVTIAHFCGVKSPSLCIDADIISYSKKHPPSMQVGIVIAVVKPEAWVDDDEKAIINIFIPIAANPKINKISMS